MHETPTENPIDGREYELFAELRRASMSFRTFATSRQFVEADLDRLAEDEVFPEEDFLIDFQEGTEKRVLPFFGGDRGAFEVAMKREVQISAQIFEQACYRYRLHMLGMENVNFFVYCFCMIHRCGQGMNPYFRVTESQEWQLNAAFRHLVEDAPIPSMDGVREAKTPTLLTEDEVYANLSYRGFVRPDGSVNRNAMKHAVIESGWLFFSDICHELSRLISLYGSLSESQRHVRRQEFQEYADGYVRNYVGILLLNYLGLTHSFHAKFLESAYPLLEELCACCGGGKKKSRDQMRLEFAEMLPGLASGMGKQVGSVLSWLVRSLAEPRAFQRALRLETPIETLYVASLACEFASDVCPLPTT